MKLYRIANWTKYYEISDSRKVDGPLTWVPVRTKTDGFGYLRITQEKNRCELLAAWYLLLGMAAKQPRAQRGTLARNGIPLTAEDMELLTRFPAAIFTKALEFFSDAKQGWLVSEDVRTDSDGTPANPDASERVLTESEPDPRTGQDRTGHNRTSISPDSGSARDVKKDDAEQIYALYPKKTGKPEALKQIRLAIQAHGADRIKERTTAYAAAVKTWPPGETRFVPDPERWFKRGRYDDDPSTWARNGDDPRHEPVRLGVNLTNPELFGGTSP